MKIYNIVTKQIVESDKLQEWADIFELSEQSTYEKNNCNGL